MTDWPALITRLERHMRHIDIAIACGRTESWVGQLKRGVIKEPPYSIGAALIALDAGNYVVRETQEITSEPAHTSDTLPASRPPVSGYGRG